MVAKNLGSVNSQSMERRTVLSALAAGGAAIGLVGCAAEPTEVATTPPSGTVTETSSPVAGRQLIGSTADVPLGSGARFKVGEFEILVTQPVADEFVGFDATCTHAGCIVTGVIDSEIACACHGARFDLANGAVRSGPAERALGRVPIIVESGQIFADF